MDSIKELEEMCRRLKALNRASEFVTVICDNKSIDELMKTTKWSIVYSANNMMENNYISCDFNGFSSDGIILQNRNKDLNLGVWKVLVKD